MCKVPIECEVPIECKVTAECKKGKAWSLE